MTLISDERSVCKLARGSEEEKQRFALPFGSKSRRAPGEFASVIRVLKIRFHIYEQQY